MITYQNFKNSEAKLQEMVKSQLEQIFHYHPFSKSKILKKFLSYIIYETMEGRSMTIKEYTIALDVLGKPVGFRPQLDCVVRIHAVRLRKALQNYYAKPGMDDELVITIPKGRYVPVFDLRAIKTEAKWNMKYIVNDKISETNVVNINWMNPPTYINYSTEFNNKNRIS